MKEFINPIDAEILSKGLRTDYRRRRGSIGLTQCLNLQPHDTGLVPYEHLTLPFTRDQLNTHAISLNWPFPMLSRGEGNTFLLTKRRIFIIDENDWNMYQIPTYDFNNESNLKEITQGGRRWSIADFGYSWFAFNGACSILATRKDAMFGGTDKAFISTDIWPECGVNFKGQLVIGGFDTEHSFPSGLKTLINSFADNSGITFDTDNTNLGPNFIMWFSPGGDEILPVFSSSIASSSHITTERGSESDAFDSTDPWITDLIIKNQFGFMPLRCRGYVRDIIRLGNSLIAYCDDGIFILNPMEIGGFGQDYLIKDIGIANKGASAGSIFKHVFIDKNGELWIITNKDGAVKIGYKEFFYDMLGNDIIVSHDGYNDRFFVSTSDKTYVFNKFGLHECNQLVTSVAYYSGYSIGYCSDLESMDKTARLALGGLDDNSSGRKTVSSIEISGDINTPGIVGIKYKYNIGDDFTTPSESDWTTLNDQGYAKIFESGVQYEPVFKFDDYRYVQLDNIKVGRQFHDRNFRRGLVEGGQGV